MGVPPGNYVVTADAGMSCELMDDRVSAGVYSTVDDLFKWDQAMAADAAANTYDVDVRIDDLTFIE